MSHRAHFFAASIEFVAGHIHRLSANNTQDLAVIYSNVQVEADLGAETVQARIRVKGGDFGGVRVEQTLPTGERTSSTAVFEITFPLGANPAAIEPVPGPNWVGTVVR